MNAHSKINETDKLIYVRDSGNKIYDSIYVPIIKTGKTPKVITGTSDNKTLLVSNWHSYNISVLQIDIKKYPFAVMLSSKTLSNNLLGNPMLLWIETSRPSEQTERTWSIREAT